MADLKQTGKKIEDVGKKLQDLGCLLTVIITIPILLTVFLGPLGFVIGAVIFIVGLWGHFSKGRR